MLSAPRILVPLHFPLPTAAVRLPKASPDTSHPCQTPAEALPCDAEARRGTAQPAGHEEVAQEPGDWCVWVETVSPGVLEPQNHGGLTAPLLPGRWRLAFRVGFPSVP